MNIGQLRELIKDLPDGTPFMVSHEGNISFGSYPAEPEISELYVFDYYASNGRTKEKTFYATVPKDAKIKQTFKALIIKTYD